MYPQSHALIVPSKKRLVGVRASTGRLSLAHLPNDLIGKLSSRVHLLKVSESQVATD